MQGRTTWVAKRPEHYFGKRKTMPEQASLQIHFPQWLVDEYGEEGAKRELAEALERHVKKARAKVAELDWTYLGAKRARRVSPFKQAIAYEAFDELVPRFSTFGLTPEEAIQVKRDYIAWQLQYDDCRRRLLAGETNILWPPGTWAMVQLFGQRAEEPAPLAA